MSAGDSTAAPTAYSIATLLSLLSASDFGLSTSAVCGLPSSVQLFHCPAVDCPAAECPAFDCPAFDYSILEYIEITEVAIAGCIAIWVMVLLLLIDLEEGRKTR